MSRYPTLSADLRKQLATIQPSVVRGVAYYPCSAAIESGQIFECVYLVEENGYFRQWGVWPENDRGKQYLELTKVANLSNSCSRLPSEYAIKIYAAGESGMGYHIFSVCFKNRTKVTYLGGGMIDFIKYPDGLTNNDICEVGVQARADTGYIETRSYLWCLFSE